jgi:ketosteroid isomerase-like protein
MIMTTATTVPIEKIAKFLVDSCRKGDFKAVMQSYYGDNIVSVEAMAMPNKSAVTEGIEAVTKASEEWGANNEVHSIEVGEPIITENHFAVTMKLDVTCKLMGNQRMMMEEIAVYEVQNGKIIRQQFFYNTQNC